MMTRTGFFHRAPLALIAWLLLVALHGCTKNETTLAPYDASGVKLSELNVQDSTYVPRVAWAGGYVSALGVNNGREAKLDTSLIWLIHQAGDGIHYPETFGQVPAGAEDLTTSFGGHPATTLVEDRTYTFWVAKEDVWSVLVTKPGKVLLADSLATVPVREVGDTLFLDPQSFLSKVNPIDLYIGIRNVRPVGRLGVINVIQTNTSNAPIITWTITQPDSLPPDSMLAEIGICSGTQYDVSSVVWDVLAVDTSSGSPVYWTRDVIASPVIAGQSIPGTAVFTAFPPGGLTRHSAYYIWIANKNWDQRSRLRSTYNYASALFETY